MTVEQVIQEMKKSGEGMSLQEREALCSEYRRAALKLIDLTDEERKRYGLL